MSKQKQDSTGQKEDSTVLKEKGTPPKVMATPKEDDFMERAKKAQEEVLPILEKYEVSIIGQLNEWNINGITAKAVYADVKKYDK